MKVIGKKIRGGVPLLTGFQPLSSLWEGPAAPYPSEQSARWQLRKLRPHLAAASAVALHCGELLIHPQRFAEVAERVAIDSFARRVSRPDECQS